MIYTGRYSEAEATLTEALALNRTWPQRDNPDVGVSLNNYGVLYQLTGQQKKSVEALRQAVAIDEKVLGADNSLSLINDVMLADALRVSGQYAEAGAKAVLATLWPVADASTAALMQALYQAHKADHLDKADALRQAQLALLKGKANVQLSNSAERGLARKSTGDSTGSGTEHFTANPAAPYAHPFFWAPFILMGNWL